MLLYSILFLYIISERIFKSFIYACNRTHQIRVHMKHRRTPVAGDVTYGNAEWNTKLSKSSTNNHPPITRPLLHAYETKLIHPFTQQSLVLQAKIPDDMQKMIQKISLGLPAPIIDEETSLLLCPLDIKDSNDWESNQLKMKGFVPYDRLLLNEVNILLNMPHVKSKFISFN